jgi:hypothetical protein
MNRQVSPLFGHEVMVPRRIAMAVEGIGQRNRFN